MKKIRKVTDLFFDCHLMVENPEKYIADFKLPVPTRLLCM